MIAFKNRFSQRKNILFIATLLVATICVSLFFVAINYVKGQQELNHAQITNPRLNDVYIIDKEILDKQTPLREKYIITQVVSIDEANVYLKESNFIYLRVNEAIRGIRTDKLLTHNFFSHKTLKMSKLQLEKLYFSGGVPEVGRSKDGMHLYGGVIIPRPKQNLIKEQKYRIGYQENQLAVAYYQGTMGYEKDWKEAFKLFKQAANKGHPYAQISLAQMYRDGDAVEVNFSRALYWFKMAKQQNISSAHDEYTQLCHKMLECSE